MAKTQKKLKEDAASERGGINIRNVLLVLVLLALLVVIGLLVYSNYYSKSKFANRSAADFGAVSQVSTPGGNVSTISEVPVDQLKYIAVEFDPEISRATIKYIFQELGLENKDDVEQVFTPAFSDQKDFVNWYRVTVPAGQDPFEFAKKFSVYHEVIFTQPITGSEQ